MGPVSHRLQGQTADFVVMDQWSGLNNDDIGGGTDSGRRKAADNDDFGG
jgi:hypothetical protein